MVYSITEAGEKYFRELFDSLLEQAFESEFALDGVLYFRDKISNEELVNVLKSKRQQLAKKLEATEKNKTNTLNNINELGRLSATLIFDHHLLHLEAELEWLARTIEGLSE
ncbi:MAG: transcriptional regulator, PadR-like family [Eubacterium sp.]|nr:transcriptional regulator, PadR-like family [Eubacterium sp.]